MAYYATEFKFIALVILAALSLTAIFIFSDISHSLKNVFINSDKFVAVWACSKQ